MFYKFTLLFFRSKSLKGEVVVSFCSNCILFFVAHSVARGLSHFFKNGNCKMFGIEMFGYTFLPPSLKIYNFHPPTNFCVATPATEADW